MGPCFCDDVVLDVAIAPGGGMLIGMDNKFCMLHMSGEDVHIKRTIEVPGLKVYAIKMIKTGTDDLFATAMNSLESTVAKDKICIYSLSDFEVRHSWEVPTRMIDMTVLGSRIYATSPLEGEIKVYDALTGDERSPIIRNGSCCGITSIPPNALLVNDREHNVVQKYKINTINGKWSIAWTVEVTRPWVSCVDSQGSILVRSNANDCITILTRNGEYRYKNFAISLFWKRC